LSTLSRLYLKKINIYFNYNFAFLQIYFHIFRRIYVKILIIILVKILFINVLTQSGTEPMQTFFEKITSLFSLMSPTSPEREIFVQSALKWSTKDTDYKTGHPDLHQKIAQVFWRGNCL